MYCPVCLNDTLKIASSGVVKLSFNKKSRTTSQLFYNLKTEKEAELLNKFRTVVRDYFQFYSGFQNKDPIKEVTTYSSDFVCSTGCRLSHNQQISVLGLLINKTELLQMLNEEASKFNIPIDPKISLE